MNITEEELEDFLEENDNADKWFKVGDISFRQLPLPGYGVMDLLFTQISRKLNNDLHIDFTIMELKKDMLDLSAVGQIHRYKRGLEIHLDLWLESASISNFTYTIQGILIGRDYGQDMDICHVITESDWITGYCCELGLEDGISFWSINKTRRTLNGKRPPEEHGIQPIVEVIEEFKLQEEQFSVPPKALKDAN